MSFTEEELDTLISHTISETIKEAVRVIEGRKSNQIGDVITASEGMYQPTATEIAEEDGFNQGILATITAAEGLGGNK